MVTLLFIFVLFILFCIFFKLGEIFFYIKKKIKKKLHELKQNIQCIHDWTDWEVVGIDLMERHCIKCGKVQHKRIEKE